MRISLKASVLAANILIYAVIILGAFTRLKDAGLGCPDWPGCYGAIFAPTENSAGVDAAKAWIEMIHRYAAGTLGILICGIWIYLYRQRTKYTAAFICACGILGLILFQALLGMWTVTLRLYPVVVMGHLLGGFAILAATWLLFLQLQSRHLSITSSKQLRVFAGLCLIVLCIQIALGGWTSANYAALVCPDFPLCQGQLWPPLDWSNAFNITRAGIFDSPGIPLENTARVTIQMAHRIGALVTTIVLSALCVILLRQKQRILQILAKLVFITLLVQIILGISNVLAGLPLVISILHNAIAAFLLILLVTINFFSNAKSSTH